MVIETWVITLLSFLIMAGGVLVKVTLGVHERSGKVDKDLQVHKTDTREELSKLRLHMADKYVSKDDLDKAMAPLVSAQRDTRQSIETLREETRSQTGSIADRIDRMIERQNTRPRGGA
jgi:hypothetical protein